MDAANLETRQPAVISSLLAGLQSGMLGVCWMLAWLGINSEIQNRSFWISLNLMATAFYGSGAIRTGFSWQTATGLALYLVVYSSIGALFAALVRTRFSAAHTLLIATLFGVIWYYASFGLLWKQLLPLVAQLHPGRSMLLGHLLFGVILGRYPIYLARLEDVPPVP
jgi:hypothetical protein